jgi:hypothetical protein
VTSISIAVAVAILTFGSGLLGLYLQKRLPQTHLSGGSKDMILAVLGLLTLLLALVLGTLVGNTYAFFATQKSELEIMASGAAGRSGARGIWSRSQASAQPDETGAQSELRPLLAGRGRPRRSTSQYLFVSGRHQRATARTKF